MGAYLSTYTTEYPSSAGLVEEGYSFPSIVAGVRLGLLAGKAKVIDGTWQDRDGGQDFLMRRTQTSTVPAAFVRSGGAWSSVKMLPPTYEKVLGAGYETPATLTDLNELRAAGLIDQSQYDAAIATVS